MMPDDMTTRAPRWQPFRMLEIPGFGDACYMEIGDPRAPALLFLHGFGGDQLTWHSCFSAFASRYRVVTVDLPGHGRSTLNVGNGSLDEMVAWVAGFLDALTIPAAHIVGHSMGGKIALRLALDHPDRVESLSLIAPAGLGGYFDAPLLRRFLDKAEPEAAEKLAARILGPASAHLVSGLARALRAGGMRSGQKEALSLLLDHAGAIGSPMTLNGVPWERIRCPVRVIWGEADTILPIPEARRLPPAAPLERVPGVGHLPQIEAPAAVVAFLNRYL